MCQWQRQAARFHYFCVQNQNWQCPTLYTYLHYRSVHNLFLALCDSFRQLCFLLCRLQEQDHQGSLLLALRFCLPDPFQRQIPEQHRCQPFLLPVFLPRLYLLHRLPKADTEGLLNLKELIFSIYTSNLVEVFCPNPKMRLQK